MKKREKTSEEIISQTKDLLLEAYKNKTLLATWEGFRGSDDYTRLIFLRGHTGDLITYWQALMDVTYGR